MRDISMERVNETRKNILEIIESATLTHEQKLTCLANQADYLMEVLDLPEGLDELLNVPIDRKCICDLSEGHAPMRPRYIIPDYAKFLKEGSKFLQLDPPTDLYEALNSLMIFYKHVPSVTNYPVYVGQLDELLEPYIDTVDEAQAKKLLKLTVDDGRNGRQIVSGIANWYQPEDLIGRKIVFVANLAPAKLCGELSEGMILACDAGDNDVRVLFLDKDVPNGSTIR